MNRDFCFLYLLNSKHFFTASYDLASTPKTRCMCLTLVFYGCQETTKAYESAMCHVEIMLSQSYSVWLPHV